MKNKFIFGSKVVVAIFCILLGVFIGYVELTNNEVIVIETYIVVPGVIIIILTAIILLILFTLEMIELVKEKKRRSLWAVPGFFAFCFVFSIVYNDIFKNNIHIIYSLTLAVGMVIVKYSIKYWKRTKVDNL